MVNELEKRDPIIDAFLFNGEQDLLKLRIKYLENFVDKFVIGQSKFTLSKVKIFGKSSVLKEHHS